jgi:hypothetical protein
LDFENVIRERKEIMSPVRRNLSQIKQLKTAVEANAETTIDINNLIKPPNDLQDSIPVLKGMHNKN